MRIDELGQDIAFVAHGLDVAGLARVIAQAPAQTAHAQIDRSVEGFGFAARDADQQLVARDHALRMVGGELKERSIHATIEPWK